MRLNNHGDNRIAPLPFDESNHSQEGILRPAVLDSHRPDQGYSDNPYIPSSEVNNPPNALGSILVSHQDDSEFRSDVPNNGESPHKLAGHGLRAVEPEQLKLSSS